MNNAQDPESPVEKSVLKLDSQENHKGPDVSHLIENFEAFALKNSQTGIDLNNLAEGQFTEVMGLLKQNEENGYNYHCKKLETVREIRLKEIEATTVTQRTQRISIISVLCALGVITILMLFFRDQYLSQWFAFIGGLGGGVGISKFAEKGKSEKSNVKFESKKDDE